MERKEKSPMQIKVEGLNKFLQETLQNIDKKMSEEDSAKSIRDLCIEYGYEKVSDRILGQVNQVKDDVKNYLMQNKLKINIKNKVAYLVDEESGQTRKLAQSTSKMLNLLGLYFNEQEEEISKDVVNKILGRLMRISILHQTNCLANGSFEFNIITLSDIKPQLNGICVFAKKENTEVILPYSFTRRVSLNKDDAFINEQNMYEELRTLFSNRSSKKSNAVIPQKALKEKSIEINAKEQDGKLIFYAVDSANNSIQIDSELAKKILAYMKNQMLTIAKPFGLDLEVQTTDEAKLDYLCKCGEFLSALYQNGYTADLLETSETQEAVAESPENDLYIEDKGIFRIILPFGINGDIETLNEVFRKCFGENIAIIMDKNEFAAIMGAILTNLEHSFEKEEYLTGRVAQKEFNKSMDKIATKLALDLPKRFSNCSFKCS